MNSRLSVAGAIVATVITGCGESALERPEQFPLAYEQVIAGTVSNWTMTSAGPLFRLRNDSSGTPSWYRLAGSGEAKQLSSKLPSGFGHPDQSRVPFYKVSSGEDVPTWPVWVSVVDLSSETTTSISLPFPDSAKHPDGIARLQGVVLGPQRIAWDITVYCPRDGIAENPKCPNGMYYDQFSYIGTVNSAGTIANPIPLAVRVEPAAFDSAGNLFVATADEQGTTLTRVAADTAETTTVQLDGEYYWQRPLTHQEQVIFATANWNLYSGKRELVEYEKTSSIWIWATEGSAEPKRVVEADGHLKSIKVYDERLLALTTRYTEGQTVRATHAHRIALPDKSVETFDVRNARFLAQSGVIVHAKTRYTAELQRANGDTVRIVTEDVALALEPFADDAAKILLGDMCALSGVEACGGYLPAEDRYLYDAFDILAEIDGVLYASLKKSTGTKTPLDERREPALLRIKLSDVRGESTTASDP